MSGSPWPLTVKVALLAQGFVAGLNELWSPPFDVIQLCQVTAGLPLSVDDDHCPFASDPSTVPSAGSGIIEIEPSEFDRMKPDNGSK
jgi:hypothetical protein